MNLKISINVYFKGALCSSGEESSIQKRKIFKDWLLCLSKQNKQTVSLCLNLADPAIFQTSISILGPDFSLRTGQQEGRKGATKDWENGGMPQLLVGTLSRWTGSLVSGDGIVIGYRRSFLERLSRSSKDRVRFTTLWNTWLYEGDYYIQFIKTVCLQMSGLCFYCILHR